MFRLTLAFSGAAAPRHYGTARTRIDRPHGEPGSSRVRCNALLGASLWGREKADGTCNNAKRNGARDAGQDPTDTY